MAFEHFRRSNPNGLTTAISRPTVEVLYDQFLCGFVWLRKSTTARWLDMQAYKLLAQEAQKDLTTLNSPHSSRHLLHLLVAQRQQWRHGVVIATLSLSITAAVWLVLCCYEMLPCCGTKPPAVCTLRAAVVAASFVKLHAIRFLARRMVWRTMYAVPITLQSC